MISEPVQKHDPGRRNLIALIGSTFVMVMLRFLWYGLLPLYLRTLGANDSQIGLVFSVSLLLGSSQIVGGILSDRWGRRHAIIWPTVALIPVLVLGVFVRHWLGLAGVVWAIAILGGIQLPGFNALLAESATDTNRGHVFGLFYMVAGIALLIGPALGASIVSKVGVPGLIGLYALGTTAAAIWRFTSLREGIFAEGPSEGHTLGNWLAGRKKIVWQFALVNSLFLIALSLTRDGPFIALHAADSIHLSEQEVNLLFSIGGVGAVLAAMIGGRLTDRFGGRRLGATALGLHALLVVLWGMSPTGMWTSYLLFGTAWMALQVGIVSYSVWFSAYMPVGVRGRMMGLVGAVGTIISSLGPQLGTLMRSASMRESVGFPRIVTALASESPFLLLLIVTSCLALMLLRMPGRSDLAATTSD